MFIKKFTALLISSLIVLPSIAGAAPPLPSRIGGTVTVDGTPLTQDTDTGYSFKVTKENGTDYDPAANDSDGLNPTNWYIIDIPIFDAVNQPGGAMPGETAVIHVYKNGAELPVTNPKNRVITVGKSGSTIKIDIEVANERSRADAGSIISSFCTILL